MNRPTPQLDPKKAAYLAWLQERGVRYPVVARPDAPAATSEAVAAQAVAAPTPAAPARAVAVVFAVEGPLAPAEQDLLTKMIAAMKLPAGDVAVTSGLGEAASLRPRVLVVMQAAGGAERGTFRDLAGVPAIATFHPRALLARPDDKRLAWDHLKLVLARLAHA